MATLNATGVDAVTDWLLEHARTPIVLGDWLQRAESIYTWREPGKPAVLELPLRDARFGRPASLTLKPEWFDGGGDEEG